jgi:hypothetical protein
MRKIKIVFANFSFTILLDQFKGMSFTDAVGEDKITDVMTVIKVSTAVHSQVEIESFKADATYIVLHDKGVTEYHIEGIPNLIRKA